jgi:hypothetical protein
MSPRWMVNTLGEGGSAPSPLAPSMGG